MKVLALISQDEKLKQLCILIDVREKHVHERIEFLKRQAKKLIEDDKKASSEHWDAIRAHLREIGKLPADYTEDKHTLVFSMKEDCIKMEDEDDRQHPLSKIFGMMIPK